MTRNALLFFIMLLSLPVTRFGFTSEINYIKIDGIINPVSSEFITSNIMSAEKKGASAIIIQLDTPGGLDPSMREIVKAILDSSVPVIVYIAPSGSRAASAGVFITYSAHLAAMAPGTNIGSAHPVIMNGKADKVMLKKIVNDAVAYIRSISEIRGRNSDWAESAVRESTNVSSSVALKTNIIDIIAKDRATLLQDLDGRKVRLSSGKEVILNTEGIRLVEVEPGVRIRILMALSSPNVAYVFMMLGMVGLYFELSSPGSILPGVVGGISLILAFSAMHTLPVNYAGIALIVLSLIFFISEIKITSYGLLALSGFISLSLGSLMLFRTPVPFLKVSIWVMIPFLLAFAVFMALISWFTISVHRRKPVSGIGLEGLLGEEGEAATDINPDGTVFIGGEYWQAWSDKLIQKGDKVIAAQVRGLKIKVEKVRGQVEKENIC